MTETDLITAGGSGENEQLPISVNSDISTPVAEEASTSTPTAETAPTADVASGDRAASLSTMVLPELRALAKQIGVEGASGMRKSELVAAIREHRGESSGSAPKAAADSGSAATTPASDSTTETGTDDRNSGEQTDQRPPRRERRGASRETGAPGGSDQTAQDGGQDAKTDADSEQTAKQRGGRSEGDKSDGDDQQGGQQNRNNQNRNNQNRNNQNQNNQDNDNDDDGEGRGGRRGRRFRDRRRRERGGDGGGGGGGDRGDRDTELREDDVVQPVAGILDVLDNYAFVRTSGYLAGPNDVYVSMNMVRKNGLRRGDAVTGAVRVAKDGEQPNQRQKFNPLVRLDTVNGGPVEDAKKRPEFTKLTPLYPNERLRLETTIGEVDHPGDRPDHADR